MSKIKKFPPIDLKLLTTLNQLVMFKTLKTLFIVALLLPLQLFAQFCLSGNVIDKENHEALIGAHISLK